MSEARTRAAPSAIAGILFLVVAVACFAVLDTTVKYIGATVSVVVSVWFRYAFQALATSAIMLPRHGKRLLHTAHPRFQLLRGLLLTAISALAFLSLQYMPVGAFTAIIMTAPLVVTLLAAVLLKERVSPLRWLLVAGGFVGTLLIVRPGSSALGWASLLPITLVLINAWFQILTSQMARTENPLTMHFYTGWVGALLASLALPLFWTVLPDAKTLALLSLIGFMGTVGHFLLILAFARAPASTLTPFNYTQIGFAMLGGWLVFGHVPGSWELSGIALIVLCGASASWITAREKRLPVEMPEP
jgi:drug/metabolite transporter (DMT)-like permease